MKYLAVLSFVIGLLAVPIQAQAQQHLLGAPESWNGLVWDPPTQGYAAREAAKYPPIQEYVAPEGAKRSRR
jgi:hypothetical protein